MSPRLVALGLVVAPAIALAQPAPGEPPLAPPSDTPPEPQAPPATPPAPAPSPAPAPPPPSPHEQCMQRRHEIAQRASDTADLGQRTKLLQSLPDCSQPDVALPPPPPPASPCRPGEQLVAGACTETAGERHGTAEISAGVGWLSGTGDTTIVHGIAGLNVGVGTFVTHDVAMTLRLSGVTWLDGGLIYLGVLGPNVQAWFGKGYVGGGIGLGVLAGCAQSSCDATATSGFDLRAGFEVSPHDTISVELESIHGFFSQDSLQTVSVLLGYQSF